MQELSDIKHNIVHSNLKRPIQLITPEVFRDANFIVPNLLQNNMGGQFATGISLSLLNDEQVQEQKREQAILKKYFTERNRSFDVTFSNKARETSLKRDLVLSTINDRLDQSIRRMSSSIVPGRDLSQQFTER